jgi:hypothetical protein
MKKLFFGLVAMFISLGAMAQVVVPKEAPPGTRYGVARPNNGALGAAVIGATTAAAAGAIRMAVVGVAVPVGATTAGTVAAGVGGLALAGAVVGFVGYKLLVPDDYIVTRP